MASSIISTGPNEQVFQTDAGEWPIVSATVFDDQAEIKRSLTFVPKSAGATLLKLRGLPNKINSSSLRADISSQNAKLTEVSYHTDYEAGKTDAKITLRLEELAVEQERLNKAKERVDFRSAKVSAHQNSVIASVRSGEIEKTQAALDPEVFVKIGSALEFYEKLRVKVQEDLDILAERQLKINKESSELRTKQAKLSEGKYVNIASVLIDIPEIATKKNLPIQVELSYLINGASWHASYDIMVEKGVDKAVLTYYGNVTNNTDEDWVEVDMALSTAKPSIGGALPPLPRKQVDFQSAQANVFVQPKPLEPRLQSMRVNPELLKQSLQNYMPPSMPSISAAPNLPISPLGFAFEKPPETTLVSSDAGASLFKIQRLANIDSDNKPHRQTISILNLEALFTHAASPKVSKEVFLKCSTKNNSSYPLLHGALGVFIDGSFVSTSELDFVRANEDFSLFLGIDDSVKLNYSPETVKQKQVVSGLMTKTKRTMKTGTSDPSA